ncbi:odorant receptor 131-2-like [Mugil cephalus]|uniref:odorant receptor 131-2-like n=1 Tax=Mugil cephalus TaxID=48193 RepID=UPI001FB80121|nr:odorant receptor 131-2-like [Mugil cephalus]
MSSGNQSVSNVTSELQNQVVLERLLISMLITVSCCVFFFINGTMLFVLRSKPVFRETCRYVLLYNLLVADTVQLALSQTLHVVAACRVMLSYPVCGVLTFLARLTFVISPLTLVVMSLERYVAVCYPLRHATIITVRNTGLAIVLVWAFSSLNIIIQVVLLLQFPFEDLHSLQMKDFCSGVTMRLWSGSADYDDGFTWLVFVSASVVIVSTYVSVTLAARSASIDKASTQKARNTLLLHLVQLGLSLSSTLYIPLLTVLYRITRIIFARIRNVLYIFIIIFPRCLSSFIYGIRDQSIRPVLMHHLCCQLKVGLVRPGGHPELFMHL